MADHNLEGFIASSGDDNITANSTASANIDGRGGNDTITGGVLGDVIHGGLGDDGITGGGGDDLILGGAGIDSLSGGTGADNLFGGTGDDTLNGGNDNDTLEGGKGDDIIDGGAGDDTVVFTGNRSDYNVALEADGSYTILDRRSNGTDGTDTVTNVEFFRFSDRTLDEVNVNLAPTAITMTNSPIDENLPGGSVIGTLVAVDADIDDTADFSIINNTSGLFEIINSQIYLRADAVVDYEAATSHDLTVRIVDGAGNVYEEILTIQINDLDLVYTNGTSASDSITGTNERDWISGGGGNDILHGGDNNDNIRGGWGKDQVFGDDGDDRLSGFFGDDILNGGAGNDHLSGMTGNDLLYGGTGNDHLSGGRSDDRLYGESGDDKLYSGSGNDFLYGGDGNDYLSASIGDNHLFGDAGNDKLRGGRGEDVLNGGSGIDILIGRGGNDILTGGEGADIFDFSTYHGWGTDTITDFANDGLEKIDFSGSYFIHGMDDLNITYETDHAVISTVSGTISLQGITTGLGAEDFLF